MNELIFITHSFFLALITGIAHAIGKEALIVWICLQTIVANLFVTKQITLLGFNATAADAFIVTSVAALNILQEFYSKEDAKKAIKLSLGFCIVMVALSLLQVWYIPSLSDMHHAHFVAILQHTPRIIAASLAAYGISQYIDYSFFAFLKEKLPIIPFSVRSIISIAFSQALDTLLFSFLGLYGIVSNLVQIMIISYGIKLTSILLIGFFIRLTRSFLQRVHNHVTL